MGRSRKIACTLRLGATITEAKTTGAKEVRSGVGVFREAARPASDAPRIAAWSASRRRATGGAPRAGGNIAGGVDIAGGGPDGRRVALRLR